MGSASDALLAEDFVLSVLIVADVWEVNADGDEHEVFIGEKKMARRERQPTEIQRVGKGNHRAPYAHVPLSGLRPGCGATARSRGRTFWATAGARARPVRTPDDDGRTRARPQHTTTTPHALPQVHGQQVCPHEGPLSVQRAAQIGQGLPGSIVCVYLPFRSAGLSIFGRVLNLTDTTFTGSCVACLRVRIIHTTVHQCAHGL